MCVLCIDDDIASMFTLQFCIYLYNADFFITTRHVLLICLQDCDGNQVIDCFDYAGMHKWGPFGGCQEHPIVQSGEYYAVLSQCLCPKHKDGNF